MSYSRGKDLLAFYGLLLGVLVLILRWCVSGVTTQNPFEGLRNVLERQIVGGRGYRLTLRLENILEIHLVVPENVEVVCNEVAAFAARTLDENQALVVRLFRERVRRSGVAFLACECDHELWSFALNRGCIGGIETEGKGSIVQDGFG